MCYWRKMYTSGPRYWNVPVLVNIGTFMAQQYCLKMWYLHSLEHAGVTQKHTVLECKNGLVLSNTRVPVSGTWSTLFPYWQLQCTYRVSKGKLEWLLSLKRLLPQIVHGMDIWNYSNWFSKYWFILHKFFVINRSTEHLILGFTDYAGRRINTDTKVSISCKEAQSNPSLWESKPVWVAIKKVKKENLPFTPFCWHT